MPHEHLQDGLYLIVQKSVNKGVDHYGILDVGNRMRHPAVDQDHPVVVHQTPPQITMVWLRETVGEWRVLNQITDEGMALDRMRLALENPNYDLFGNNCEHFAKFVSTGKKESLQVVLGVIAGGFLLYAVFS